jgi:hypothetical protein
MHQLTNGVNFMATSKLTKTAVKSAKIVNAVSTFPVSFTFNKRAANGRQINNILERQVGQYAQVSIIDLVNKVNTGSNVDFLSALERYQKLAIMFDPANFPVSKLVPLGVLASDEDIQRELDIPHATHIFAYFDEQRVQSIQAVKTPGKEEYTMVNGQHTATSVALIVASGLMKGWKAKDWKKFPILVSYIETNDRSKARETFALLNGEMSKEISTFDHWKQHYLSVRLDGSGNPKYLHTAKLIETLKKYNCTPLPEGHDDAGMPGAVTHLNAVETAGKLGNYDKVEFIFSNRDKFWNNLPVDNTEFGFYGSLFDITEDQNILRKSKDFEAFMVDIHAVVQQVFSGMPKLKASVTKAYKRYRYDQFLDKNASVPFNVALYVCYKVYKMLGGTYDIPALNSLYVNKNVDVIHYLTDTETAYINTFVPAKSRIKVKTVAMPKKTKKA